LERDWREDNMTALFFPSSLIPPPPPLLFLLLSSLFRPPSGIGSALRRRVGIIREERGVPPLPPFLLSPLSFFFFFSPFFLFPFLPSSLDGSRLEIDDSTSCPDSRVGCWFGTWRPFSSSFFLFFFLLPFSPLSSPRPAGGVVARRKKKVRKRP